MAGIYIHIPFCKQACVYCNFHFSTNLALRDNLVKTILQEINLRSNYLGGQIIETIYFGGGTPSLLNAVQIHSILDSIYKIKSISSNPEITIEVNPDDIHKKYADELFSLSFNRLSIGIQSFFDEDMRYMHRAHDSHQAKQAVITAQDSGFNNITVDLIYGIPDSNLSKWQQNLAQVQELRVQHLSCYALTVEPKTALAYQISKQKSKAPSDQQTIEQLEYLIDHCQDYGFEQYEISNFSKPGYKSRHNSNYWNGIPYLGLGPSAHSYNGISRQWNISNNVEYIHAIDKSLPFYEIEALTDDMKYNEMIMTQLRTSVGINKNKISDQYVSHFMTQVKKMEAQKNITESDGFYRLSKQGMFIADSVITELFV